MKGKWFNTFYSILMLTALALVVLANCAPKPVSNGITWDRNEQGVSYTITYFEGMPCISTGSYTLSCDWSKWKGR